MPPGLIPKAVRFWPHAFVCVWGGIAYWVLIGKPVENGPFTRPRLRWEVDSIWNVKTGRGRCEWIDLAEDWDKLWAVVQMFRNFGFHTLRKLS